MTDEKIVERAINGDNNALESLYQSTYKAAIKVAYDITKNKEDAEDIVQDSYIAAFSNIQTLKNKKSFDSWLYQIVGNRCKNYVVKKKPSVFSTWESDDNDLSFVDNIEEDSTEFIPDKSVDYTDTKEVVQMLLDELPEDQRLCIEMYYFQDLKEREIANALGIPVNTVKSRISYAKKKMKNSAEEKKKKGYVLLGLSPALLFPFMRWMFQSSKTAIPPIGKALLTGSKVATAAKVASNTASAINGASKVAKTAVSKHIAAKIIAAIIGLSVLGGTVVVIAKPDVVHKVDVFDWFETPQSVVEEYFDDFNNRNFNSMFSKIDKNSELLNSEIDFLGLKIKEKDSMEFNAKLGNFKVNIENIDVENLTGDTADVYVDLSLSGNILGELGIIVSGKDEYSTQFKIHKVGENWLIYDIINE